MTGTTAFSVRRVAGAPELESLLRLRREVFCLEQGVPENEELDGRDAESIHLVAVSTAGEVIGTCRLLMVGPTVQLSRLAVSAEARRLGVASSLLAEAEAETRTLGGRRIMLHAQTYARGLYERAGYRARGRVFVEAAIEHIAMEKSLSGRFR